MSPQQQTPFWDSLRSETCTPEDMPNRRQSQHEQQSKEMAAAPYDDYSASWVDFSDGDGRSAFRHDSHHHHHHQRRRPLKSVSFAPQVRVHITLGRWELSADEHADTWLSSDDTKRSQDDILVTVRAMRKCHPTDGDEALPEGLTSRGVEHMRTRESIAERRYNKLEVVDAVLEEQAKQRLENMDNPIVLAEASMFVSKKCRTKAEMKGASDAACARVYHRMTTALAVRRNKSPSSSRRSSSRDAPLKEPQEGAALDDYSASFATVSTAASTQAETHASPYEWSNGIQVQGGAPPSSAEQDGEELMRGWDHGLEDAAAADGQEKDVKSEIGAIFTNISHRKLREKLMTRMSEMALGA